jgi:hypothetical protein
MGEPYFEPAATDILAAVMSAGSAVSAGPGRRDGRAITRGEPVIEATVGIA